MTRWKSKVQSCLTLLALFCILCSINLFAEPVKKLELKAGVWEGIDSQLMDYNLLELGADGHHRLFNAEIASAFKKGKVLTFSDEQIACTSSECVINITLNNQDITRLIITPYLASSYKVLEINTDSTGKPIFTQSYQLDQKFGQSTIRNFLEDQKSKLAALKDVKSYGVYGLWLGVLTLDEKAELISLAVYPDKKSIFTYYANGSDSAVKIAFEPDKLKFEQDVIYIETEHVTFANKLIMHQFSANQLGGYMYSIHKGQTLQTGRLSFIRLK